MITAHSFQEKFTGVQIFVFHCKDEIQAKSKFSTLVVNSDNWIYLGEKQVLI